MNRQDVSDAIAALESAGERVTNAAILKQLGKGSLRDIQRRREALAAESTATATAVAEEPEPEVAAPEAAPDTQMEGAQARLEAAQRHLAAVERSPALAQRLSLVTAMRAGVITRSDPAWQDFDEAQQQLARATEAVEHAQEALQAAQRIHQARLREHAAVEYAATAEGQAVVEEIERLQKLYDHAAATEGPVGSYSHAMGLQRHAFQEGVVALLATHQPAPPEAPGGPPPRLTVEVLRGCYLHDGIGRVMPAGVARFEFEDSAVLAQLREVLREEMAEANRAVKGYEMDDEIAKTAWHDARGLPMRQARHRGAQLYTAVQLITQDMQNLQQRARNEGRAL